MRSYVPAAFPVNEEERLRELRRYEVLDTAAEKTYDNLTFLAAHICSTPSALISLIDADRQWFKSRFNYEGTQGPRDLAFCAHAILQPEEMFIVSDAKNDPRVQGHPGVVSGDVAYYAGAPIVSASGYALGTLCVIDRVPRALSAEQLKALRVVADEIVTQLELRRHRLELRAMLEAIRATAGIGTSDDDSINSEISRAREIVSSSSNQSHVLEERLRTVLERLQELHVRTDPPKK